MQLLLAVNVPIAVLVTVFLALDFRREMSHRVAEKRIALDEEAKTMLPAVLQMRRHGNNQVQRYIDSVCGRMQDSESPGHHIAVVLPGAELQAEAHHRASPEMMYAVQRAADSPLRVAKVGEREIIVGHYDQDGVRVFVSETMESLRQEARSDLARQLAGFLVMGGVAAFVVNFVLLRLVTTPLTRLVDTVRDIANGKLDSRADAFSSAELRFLANDINKMSQALDAAGKYRAMQMAKARDIQRHVLPDEDSMPGLRMASLFLPADEASGDYYDMISLPDKVALLCVADVTGHGISAAMTTVLLRSLLRMAAETWCHPGEILEFVNHRFVEAVLTEDFASVFLLRIDLRSGLTEYASAGHGTGWLLCPDGERRELESTGLILGIDEDATWESRELQLLLDDRLLVVTDGVTECRAADGRVFGSQRLTELVEACSALSLDETVDQIRSALDEFRQGAVQQDDVTVLLAALDDPVVTVAASLSE